MDQFKVIKEKYFSNPDRQVRLKAGEVLLSPGEQNHRLFLIKEGLLIGLIVNDSGEPFEIFRSEAGKLVGTYSFFDPSHTSYSTVKAEEDALLAYIDMDMLKEVEMGYEKFAKHMLPLVVSEIYSRQLLAHRASIERNEAIKRLMLAEKLASLGQMAAGLAHELNNAIGVIYQKTEWIAERITHYLKGHSDPELFPFYQKGFLHGQPHSTSQIRARRKAIQKAMIVDHATAKKLAKTGLEVEEIIGYKDHLEEKAEQILYFFEMGLALHDMRLASKQATSVVQSVKELGAAHRQKLEAVDLTDTIREAVTLLKSMLRKVKLDLRLSELPSITVNSGDFVQIWINILKNAVEALLGAKSPRPCVKVISGVKNGQIEIQIEDNGPGIPDHLKQKIFQPNFTTKVNGLSFGLGLGLPKVQKLVESYAGTISLNSKPGKTAFIIRIPIT